MIIPEICRGRWTAILAAATLLTCATQARAALSYNVYLNTASLIGNTNAPFSLDVVLGSGSQTPNSDNTITLSNFIFTNGSVGAVSYSAGGETGSMSSTVTLTNSAQGNELAQQFSSGVTQIQFSVSMTSNTNNPFPDQFDVAILDGGLNNVATTDPSMGNTLVSVDLSTGQTLNSVHTYRSTANSTGPGIIAAVPEPAPTAGLLLGTLVGFGWLVRRKTARA